MSQHLFDQAIALTGEPNSRKNTISPAYQNMVGPFGGVTAATLLNSVLTHPEVIGSPVSMTVNYLGPIKSDDITINPRLVKTNRSNQHWMIEVFSGDEMALTALMIFALRVDSWSETDLVFPEVPAADGIQSMPTDLLPPWPSQYDMRFVKGNPFAEQASADEHSSESLQWVSDKPARKLDFASLAALSDVFFPRLFVRERTVAPVGTVSLTTYFHVDAETLNSIESPWVLAHARAGKFANSYFDHTGEIWSQDGTLLATTNQVAYYKY
ncbi:MAG: acyl-CoA thioesterase [Cellvibrionaceae bacterium]